MNHHPLVHLLTHYFIRLSTHVCNYFPTFTLPLHPFTSSQQYFPRRLSHLPIHPLPDHHHHCQSPSTSLPPFPLPPAPLDSDLRGFMTQTGEWWWTFTSVDGAKLPPIFFSHPFCRFLFSIFCLSLSLPSTFIFYFAPFPTTSPSNR